MEIKGTVVQILDVMSGESQKGTWRKQGYILELPGSYPRKVCVDVWGDNIDNFQIKEQEELTVSIDINSREYNGKWYTDIKAWKVQREGIAPPQQAGPPNEVPPPEKMSGGNDMVLEDDLPF